VITFLIETLRLGIKNIYLHKLRSMLTALGIIFGVSAVILMVAIGEGNKQKALADIERLGTRNIILRSIKPPASDNAGDNEQMLSAYGLTRTDLKRIEQTVTGLSGILPLKQVGSDIYRESHRVTGKVFGTHPSLREIMSLRMDKGRFLTEVDQRDRSNVAVIGHEVALRLFPLEDPVGKTFQVDTQSFVVIGVMEPVGLAGGAGASLVGRDLNFDIYIPYSAARLRFGDVRSVATSGNWEATQVELSELIVQVAEDRDVLTIAAIVERILNPQREPRDDLSVIVPLELLEQQKRTMRLFNFLMTAIAAISLIVGGIGIMNIMLASVTERTREIGIRRALGATRPHIIAQFLTETTVLSGLGGIAGVGLGILSAVSMGWLIAGNAQWAERFGQPLVPMWVVLISFIVATSVGVVFGLYPAIKASQQDPIVALRHE